MTTPTRKLASGWSVQSMETHLSKLPPSPQTSPVTLITTSLPGRLTGIAYEHTTRLETATIPTLLGLRPGTKCIPAPCHRKVALHRANSSTFPLERFRELANNH